MDPLLQNHQNVVSDSSPLVMATGLGSTEITWIDNHLWYLLLNLVMVIDPTSTSSYVISLDPKLVVVANDDEYVLTEAQKFIDKI